MLQSAPAHAANDAPADSANETASAGALHEVFIDRSECNACSGCCDICPDVFEWDDAEGRPCLKSQHATHDEVREAIALCPRRCISIEGWTEEFY